jgi:hypothetical protein
MCPGYNLRTTKRRQRAARSRRRFIGTTLVAGATLATGAHQARPQPEPFTIERALPMIDEAGVDRVVISKKFENHCHALALYFVCFCRVHKTLVTPAMAAGIAPVVMSMADVVTMIEEREGPAKKRTYKKRGDVEQISN